LGCTHYPLLITKIMSFMPQGIQVISQGPVIAESLKDYLGRHPEMDDKIKKTANVEFYTTENPGKFNGLANLFYEAPIEARHITL
jgi:glutamate racemase